MGDGRLGQAANADHGFIYENQAALYRLAFSYTHNRDAALDIVQDTVVQAISHADACAIVRP